MPIETFFVGISWVGRKWSGPGSLGPGAVEALGPADRLVGEVAHVDLHHLLGHGLLQVGEGVRVELPERGGG